jgi:hypothetical protein
MSMQHCKINHTGFPKANEQQDELKQHYKGVISLLRRHYCTNEELKFVVPVLN